MPGRSLESAYAGMAGSTGSCDSMASVSSNHSALSDASYDYLSVEERDALMYLEETIDSLDAEGDSRISTDDSERVEDVPKPALPENAYDSEVLTRGSFDQQTIEKNSSGAPGKLPAVAPKSSYSSLPENLKIPRAEFVQKSPVYTTMAQTIVETSSTPEKPLRKSLASKTKPTIEIIPPPEKFRDKFVVTSSSRDVTSDCVDSIERKRQSLIFLENQPFVPSSRNGNLINKLDSTRVPLQPPQPGSAPPASVVDLQPLNEMTRQRPASSQQVSQVSTALPGNMEPQKESEALRIPHLQTNQVLNASQEELHTLKGPPNLKPSYHPPTQASPVAQHQKSADRQPVKEQVPVRPLPSPMPEHVGKDANQRSDLFTIQNLQKNSASQETGQSQAGKTASANIFKQGPATHPKPSKMMPRRFNIHPLMEPITRERTWSLPPARNIIKDMQAPRQEALEKLKLDKPNSQSESTVKSPAVVKTDEVPIPQAGQQKPANLSSTDGFQAKQKDVFQDQINCNINHARPSSGVQSTQFPLPPKNASILSTSPVHPTGVPKTKEILVPQSSKENPPNSGRIGGNQPVPVNGWQEKRNSFSVSPDKFSNGLRSREFGGSHKADMESGKGNPQKSGRVAGDQSSPKSRLQDKTSTASAIPEKTPGSLSPSEHTPLKLNTERDSRSGHTRVLSSSQLELNSEQGFGVMQGLAPRFKENVKSNTLERSGIGLGYDRYAGEQNQHTNSSFFSKKVASNFPKKSKMNSVSIAPDADFKAIQESATPSVGDSGTARLEIRRSSPFSMFSLKTPVNSSKGVRIAPKSTPDEHQEALKKLGMLPGHVGQK